MTILSLLSLNLFIYVSFVFVLFPKISHASQIKITNQAMQVSNICLSVFSVKTVTNLFLF